MSQMTKKPRFKMIFTLKIMVELSKLGFEPVYETDNVKKPGFKCWAYELTPEFEEAFSKLVKGGQNNE